MAKKQTFGTDGSAGNTDNRHMAKVIVAQKTANNKFGYKEAIVDQDDVQNFINENKE